MDNIVNPYCRLCFCTKTNENFEEISDFLIASLDILLLKLNFDESKLVICKDCALKVTEASTFKSICLCTENTITSYIDEESGSSVDLVEIYAKEKGTEQLNVSTNDLYDHKVCRLCMQLLKGKFMSLHEVDIEAIEIYIPEINFIIVKDPVICQQCFDSVGTYSSFIKNCLEVDENIEKYYDSKGSLSTYEISESLLCIKTEDGITEQENEYKKWMNDEFTVGTLNVKVENGIIKQEESKYEEYVDSTFNVEVVEKDDGQEIKTECIDIKPEEDYESSENSVTLSIDDDSDEMDPESGNKKDNPTKFANIHRRPKHKTVLESQMHKCPYCDLESLSKLELENHIKALHKNILLGLKKNLDIQKLFHCEKCSFVSRYKSCLKKHQLRHKDPSQVQMYECDRCTYKSKFKSDLKKHQNKYNDSLQVQMYKCDKCDFETKYKGDIKVHQLRHTNPSEEEMYHCNECSFVTKYRSSFRTHQLVHKDPSQVQMYKCEKCDFKSKHKATVKNHELRHKDPSREETYPCDKCSYVGLCRVNLKNHQLKHKDPSEVRMYKCDICSYESRYAICFRRHQLKHKDPSQLPMYKCDECDYEAKLKENLKHHKLKHTNPSKDEMYRCDKCSYVTKYRSNLKQHEVRHKDSGETQMYKCDKCSFETVRRGSWTRHQLVHEDIMYKCDKCNFETKHKNSLKKHNVRHKDPSEEETV